MRARNIKPGFFKNEELAEVHPLGRILFAGLWCLADKAGRLEDRPKRIKIELLPYDNCNLNSLLDELASRHFITRYSVNGSKYIEIPQFSRHQHCHVNEAPSELPGPQPEEHHTSTVQIPEAHHTSTGQTPEEHDTSTVLKRLDTESLLPITDSLNTSSLKTDSRQSDSPYVSTRAREATPFNEILRVYHELLPELPHLKELNAAIKTSLKSRWIEHPDLRWWEDYFTQVREYDWLMGRSKEDWSANFTWLIGPKNMSKVLGGFYSKTQTTIVEPMSKQGMKNLAVANQWLKEREAERNG
jgi:hypothetical protein